MSTLENKTENDIVLNSSIDTLINILSTSTFKLFEKNNIKKISDITKKNLDFILKSDSNLFNKKEIKDLIQIKTNDLRFFKTLINDKKYFEYNKDRSNLINFKKEDRYYSFELIASNFSSETLDYLDSIKIYTYGELLEINLTDIRNLECPSIRTKKEIYDTVFKLKLNPSFLDDYIDVYENESCNNNVNFN